MVTFRPATILDVEKLLSLMPLYYESDHLTFDDKKALKAVTILLKRPDLGQIWFLIEQSSSQVIGYYALAFSFSLEFGGKEAFIDELFLLEDYRGRGFGSRAIEHAISECAKNEVVALRLEVTPTNPKALKLYKRLGFDDLNRSLLARKI